MLIRYEKKIPPLVLGGLNGPVLLLWMQPLWDQKKNGEKSGSNTHKLHSQNMKGKKRHNIRNIIEYFQLYSFNK